MKFYQMTKEGQGPALLLGECRGQQVQRQGGQQSMVSGNGLLNSAEERELGGGQREQWRGKRLRKRGLNGSLSGQGVWSSS